MMAAMSLSIWSSAVGCARRIVSRDQISRRLWRKHLGEGNREKSQSLAMGREGGEDGEGQVRRIALLGRES
jgi:hypothetical protein